MPELRASCRRWSAVDAFLDLTDDFRAVRPIRPLDGTLYAPAGESDPDAVLALCVSCADPWGNVVDGVAWAWDRPGKWWRRTGRVDRLVDPKWLLGERIRLVETPAEWLADRCESACVLDWSIDLTAIFFGLEVVPTTPRLAARLAESAVQWPAFRVM